jgi:TatA/E family protein of Tat protein translocase
MISPTHLVLLAFLILLALVIFGPKRLPELGNSVGRAIQEFKKASSSTVDEVKKASASTVEEGKSMAAAGGTTMPPQQVAASPDGSSANGTGDSTTSAPLSEIKAG